MKKVIVVEDDCETCPLFDNSGNIIDACKSKYRTINWRKGEISFPIPEDCPLNTQAENTKVQNFLEALEALSKGFNLSISHEDCHGGFIIEDYQEFNIKWLKKAAINIPEPVTYRLKPAIRRKA